MDRREFLKNFTVAGSSLAAAATGLVNIAEAKPIIDTFEKKVIATTDVHDKIYTLDVIELHEHKGQMLHSSTGCGVIINGAYIKVRAYLSGVKNYELIDYSNNIICKTSCTGDKLFNGEILSISASHDDFITLEAILTRIKSHANKNLEIRI